MVARLNNTQADFEQTFAALLGAKREMDMDVRDVVADIIADVRVSGDKALLDYTKKFDRMSLRADALRVSDAEIKAALSETSPETLAALKSAASRIKAFHEKQSPSDLDYTDEAGVRLGQRWSAVDAVGLYVPGGIANYPSSVLMNAVPAVVAGVERIAMTVPTPDGVMNPAVLAAAHIAGVTEIYRVGGAQAIAALAYGTDTIKAVDKIVGPGNAYVAEAKRQVFGTVGIDTIAGPSEILVVADNQNNPRWIAADLLSQAEHDPVAQSILITDDAVFAKQVEAAIEDHLASLSRRKVALEAWANHGAIILVDSLDNAAVLINRLAPEHLELAVADPDAMMAKVKHAGAVFLGRHTPEAIGDYVAGPNHVLPTARAARFSGGLSVYDFMKRTTFVGCDAKSLRAIGGDAVTLANEEGLTAHALSITLRLEDEDE